MADHVKIGDTLGFLARAWDVLRQERDDAAAGGVTIDGVARLKEEANVTFDGAGAGEDKKFVHRELMAFFRRWEIAIDALIADLLASVFVSLMLRLVRPDIKGKGTSADDLVRELREQMFTDAEKVERNLPTVTAVTADGDNAGDGTVVVSIIEPEESDSAATVVNERIQPENFLLQCVLDSFTGGAVPGSELFDLQGSLHLNGPSVPVKDAESANENRLTNHGFENFAVANTPDTWNIQTGVVGTHIFETAVAGEVFRGSKALKLTGDGALAKIELDETEDDMVGFSTSFRLRPKRHYLLSARIKTDLVATGTVRLILKGTGYTAGATEKIELVTPGTQAYTLATAVILMPKTLPAETDFRLAIEFEGTPLATEDVFIDDIVLQEMTFWEDAGIVVGVVRGTPLNDFVQGPPEPDFFTWETANGLTGIIQSFLTRVTQRAELETKQEPDVSIALPAAAAATANYAETKAE